MNKIAFLDRDGVINKELGKYVQHEDEWELNTQVIPVLQFLQAEGYYLVVTTNQGGIARGLFTEADLEKTHAKMVRILATYGITLHTIYHCPHHPWYGMCLCRKPLSGMLERGLARHRGDKSKCLMIGDTERDHGAAIALGIPCFKIKSNEISLDAFRVFYRNTFSH